MHRVIGGLAPAAPGYRELRIEPRPGGGLTWARTAHLTPYGLAEVSWRRADGILTVDITVPAGLRPRPSCCRISARSRPGRAAPVQLRLPRRGRRPGMAPGSVPPGDRATLTVRRARLRAEHLDQPFGIGERRPRLSWLLPRGRRAGRVPAGHWDGWRQRVGASRGQRARPVAVRAARLGRAGDRAGRGAHRSRREPVVGAADRGDRAAVGGGLGRCRSGFRRRRRGGRLPGSGPPTSCAAFVTVGRPVARARLYATAHGLYEVFLGGVRVGDLELTPGFTQYAKRLQVQAYDVTGLLRRGRRRWTVLLSDGWCRGQVGIAAGRRPVGDRTAFLGQLRVAPRRDDDRDRHRTVLAEPPSHILAADLIEGQRTDLRRAGGGVAGRPAGEHRLRQLVWSPAPPVRRVEEIRPVSVTRLGAAARSSTSGRTSTAGCGSGSASASAGGHRGHAHPRRGARPGRRRHDRSPAPGDAVPAAAAACRAGRHGRLRRADGASSPGTPPTASSTSGSRATPATSPPTRHRRRRAHRPAAAPGGSRCSDDRLNRLHDAAVWSFRDNACDIPTDCPHRERAGWTGDWQLYVPTAAFLYDVAGFSVKWLRDLAVDQWDDGIIANMSPMPRRRGARPGSGGRCTARPAGATPS